MSASDFSYRVYDLTLRSDIALARAMAGVDGIDAVADLTLVRGTVQVTGVGAAKGFYAPCDQGLLVVADGVRCLCEATGRMTVDAPLAVMPAQVERVVTAIVLPGMLWMRGDLVLHASSLVLPGHDGAVVILGRSGDGKSTMAGRLYDRGAAIVSDDNIRLYRRDGGLWVAGMPGLISPRIRGTGPDADRRMTTIPPELQCQAAPLDAIYLLNRGVEPSLARLSGFDVLGALLANRYQARAQHALGRTKSLLPVWAKVAEGMQGWLWTRTTGQIELGRDEWAALDAGRPLLSEPL